MSHHHGSPSTDTTPTGRSKLVAVLPAPLPLAELHAVSKHHPDANLSTGQGGFWVRTPGSDCRCHRCFGKLSREFAELTGGWLHPTLTGCPACGDKRCPKASDHTQACAAHP